MKRPFLIGTSALALIGGVSALAMILGAAAPASAQDPSPPIIQNDWEILVNPMDPIHTTIDHTVTGDDGNTTGTEADTFDSGSLRENSFDTGYANDSAGIGHDQQNNGDQNAIGAATNAVINAGAPTGFPTFGSDVTQHLGIDQSTTLGKYRDVVVGEDDDSRRINNISNSFRRVLGILATQQNNGDGNAMAIGHVVAAQLPGNPTLDDAIQKLKVRGFVKDNATRDRNFGCSGCSNSVTGERVNQILNSAYNGSAGIISVQQNNGNANVMGSGTAVVASIGTLGVDIGDEDLTDQSVQVLGETRDGVSFASSVPGASPDPPDRLNLIDISFLDVKGIVNVQQNNGDQNVLGQGTAVFANINAADDIDDVGEQTSSAPGSRVATVGQVVNNDANPSPHGGDIDQNRVNRLLGSFTGVTGIVNLQQNNGNHNVLGQANGVTANINTDPLALTADDAAVAALAKGGVKDNDAKITDDVDRVNIISGSFNGTPPDNAKGIVNAQQNNGDNNVMQASLSIAVSIGSPSGNFIGTIVGNTALIAIVSGNTSVVEATNSPPGLSNTLTSSFQNFQGIRVVQQNNGSNNVMQSAVAVVANL